MNRLKFSIYLFILCGIAAAHNLNPLYFMNEWSSRSNLNASFAPEYGYISVPFLGNSKFNISTNFGVSNFIFPYQNSFATFMHESVDAKQFLSNLKENTILAQDMNINVLSFGFHGKNSDFWTISFDVKEELLINVPKSLFYMAKVGMSNLDSKYNLRDLSLNHSYVGELSLGYSKDLNREIRIGGKVKLLSGYFASSINYSKFEIDLNQNSWSVDAQGEFILDSRFASFKKDANGYIDFEKYDIDLSKFKPAGYGIGLDIGATYKPIESLSLGASISDLGFMNWNRTSWQRGVAQSNINFSGFSNVDINNINVDQQLTNLNNEARNIFRFKEDKGEDEYKIEALSVKFNLSAEYSFFNNPKRDILVGLLFNNRIIHQHEFTDFMGALSIRPNSWMMTSLTYSIFGNYGGNWGLAINLSPKWINCFLAIEGINTKVNKQFIPLSPFFAGVQFGVTIPLHKNIKSKPEKIKNLYK